MDKKVAQYIKKQPSPQKEICQEIRNIILATFPDINENFKNGVPWYEDRYYIVSLKDHVNVGFCINGLTKDELKLLEGSGKLMRHVKIKNLKDIDRQKIIKLLKLCIHSCDSSPKDHTDTKTEFYQRCYELLKIIPEGRVTTYKEIATALGTKAYRAVGSAMAKNPDPILIPCHRVVKSSGEIGNFGLGIEKKIELLNNEGVMIKDNKIEQFDKVLYRFNL